jgi:hypothetical protein
MFTRLKLLDNMKNKLLKVKRVLHTICPAFPKCRADISS